VVSRRERLNFGPHLDDDTRGLVAENQRQRLWEIAVDDVKIAGAHAAGRDLHEHLALLRRRQVDLEDLDGLARLPKDRRLRFHGTSLVMSLVSE
jgi:hypothetical protein